MAKVTKIALSLDRKVSDGDYGSMGVSYFEEVTLENGDDINREKLLLNKRVKKEMGRLISELLERLP